MQLLVDSRPPQLAARKTGRIQAVVLIVLLHLFLIWALRNGLARQLGPALPSAIFVTMIEPAQSISRPKAVIAVKSQKMPVSERQLMVPVAETPLKAASPIESPLAASALPTPPESPESRMPQSVETTPEPNTVHGAVLPKTISTGVEYLRAPQPRYPPLARRLREQGKALIRVLVDQYGVPQQAEVQQSSGSARLDQAARLAVLNALFKPLQENGQTLAVYVLVPIRFQLDS